MDYISVNTKMNFAFKVEVEVIKDSIQSIFNNTEYPIRISDLKVMSNIEHSNVSVNLNYKIGQFSNFSFQTKMIIFLIEQKIYSLINTKPININLVFEGVFNEK
ncbi:MMB_0454 family protein [Mycoplasma phocoeninasale]|uniref:Asp23/Gls24 family envelope stress response protein n=1 Tax=Mycoplasma phocoeninasale TaxID=2726117 RepID=A0A858U7B6_9MOLU|nr:hypothetical protein [Mycoplasma phocoeninasale]MBN0970818.1 hypothetical protein [Mycoplasma phocoeninasale]QJG66678.1 hypothetical protein HGG64_03175 [Mycoplasma phocoeninasale]